MKRRLPLFVIVFLIITNISTLVYFYPSRVTEKPLKQETFEEYQEVQRIYQGDPVSLPEVEKGGFLSVEEAIMSRRSRREYALDPLTLQHISQLLWSAQGVTSEDGKRAVPSARELYPLNIYVVAKNVVGLENGVYHYIVEEHKLGKLVDEGVFGAFFKVAQQPTPKNAAAIFVITANYPKVAQRFEGEAVKKVALQESGHLGQNLYLQVESLSLGMSVMSDFNPQGVKEALSLPEQETVVYLIPIGNKKLE